MSSAWPTVALGDVLTDIQPGFASGRHNSEGWGLPHFRPMNISTEGQIDRRVMKYVDASAGRSELRLRRGDILFNNTNSPELVGKTAFFGEDDSPGFSNHMTRLRIDTSRVDARFAALRLHQAWREGWFAAHCNNHVSQASIGRDILKSFEIELPPLEVQQAIASLSDTIGVSRSSSSLHLGAARRAIERFRQAVLTAACSGRLTAEWRADQPNIEPAETALVRHQADNQNLNINKRRLKPAHGLRLVSDEFTFPQTWAFKPVRELVANRAIVDVQDGNHGELYPRREDFTEDRGDGVPYISAESITDVVLLDQAPRLNQEAAARLRIGFARPRDVILTHNATVGRVAILPEDSPNVVLSTSTTYYRTQPDVLLPPYLALYMRSHYFQRQLTAVMEQTTRNQVPVTKQVELSVAVPPLVEQVEVVRCSHLLLELATTVSKRLERAALSVERSSQAILAKAFRGELV